MAKSLIHVENPLLVIANPRNGDEHLARIRSNIAVAVTIILFLYVTGAIIYHGVEGWTWLESVYFMTVTFTTVGYGDIVPKTDFGRMFTIIIIWGGISTALFLLYSIAEYRETVVDKQIQSNLKRFKHFFTDRMKKREGKKK